MGAAAAARSPLGFEFRIWLPSVPDGGLNRPPVESKPRTLSSIALLKLPLALGGLPPGVGMMEWDGPLSLLLPLLLSLCPTARPDFCVAGCGRMAC